MKPAQPFAITLALLASALWCFDVAAQDRTADKPGQAEEKAAPVPEPKVYRQSASGQFDGETIRYTVTAGETHLLNDKDEPVASIFSTAYIKDPSDDPATRPVTFVFNGGPGSASLWLHMGFLGPRRIVVPSDGTPAGAPPYEIEDNPLSALDVTDLVFVDPVGTGYSRVVGAGKTSDFWGITEDAKSLAEFIRLFVTQNKRWNSPRFILGESYGTTRAAALVHQLQDEFYGMAVNGVLLVSSILDFQYAAFGGGDIGGYIGFLPTYAATAWHHGKLQDPPEDLATLLREVERFAIEDYAPALLKGTRLAESERTEIARTLARFTGLSETYILRSNLRIPAARFRKELLREDGLSVGRFDSRYTADDLDDVGEFPDFDPSSYGIDSAYAAGINDYLTRELGVDFSREYRILPSDVGRSWNWSPTKRGGPPTHVNVAPWLGDGMRQNKDLRVFVASGYYDLATPYFATDTTMAQNGIDPARVTTRYYEAGHMMYTHTESLEQLAADVRDFIEARDR